MSVSQLLVKSYSTNIYLNHSTTLDYVSTNKPEYVQPVMQRGADFYYIEDMEDSVTAGSLTQEQADAILALKGPEDPTNRPIVQMMVGQQTVITE